MALKGDRVKSSNYPSVVSEVSYINKIKPRTCCCMKSRIEDMYLNLCSSKQTESLNIRINEMHHL